MRAKQFHRQIARNFKSRGDDKQLAIDLEKLFNNILYDEEVDKYDSSLGGLLEKIINTEAKAEIKKLLQAKYPFLASDFSGEDLVGNTSVETGDLLESIIDIVGQVILQENNSNYKYKENLSITGAKKRVIEIPNEVARDFSGRLSRTVMDSSGNYNSDNRFTVRKQMKTDNDFNRFRTNISLSSALSPEILKLLSISITAKNYATMPVELENIIISQAYAGMVSYLNQNVKRYQRMDVLMALYEYYASHNDEEAFFQHLSHIVRIQALVGAGQLEVNSVEGTRSAIVTGPAVMPRFLIINLRSKRHVYVRSTFAIIEEMLKRDSEQLIVSGSTAEKTQVSYRIDGIEPSNMGKLRHS